MTNVRELILEKNYSTVKKENVKLRQKLEVFKDGKIQKLVDDLFWEYDRMSRDGKANLDRLAELVLPKHSIEDQKKELLAMGCPKEELHLYLEGE